MARAKIDFLSRNDMERIHSASMKILGEVGVIVHSPSTTKILLDVGAVRSKDGNRVLISEEMVKSAVASAPRSILLAGVDKKHDMTIPAADGRLFVACGGEAVFVKNLITGEQRYSTTEDVRDFTIFVNEIPQIDFAWLMVGAVDQPAHIKYLVELKTAFEYTTKHIQSMSSAGEESKDMIEIASIISGGRDALEKRCTISAVQCPISPLTFEKGLVEGQVEFARANVPVVSMAAAVAGLTSPVTIAGTIAQVNAENMASLVITQATRKGAPWIFGSDSSPGNLRTGSVEYGAFETFLLRASAGQMGRFNGLPTMVAGIGLENSSISMSGPREGVPYMAVQALVDSDLGTGIGGIDSAAGASYEQFIADAWVWDLAREFRRDFDTDAAAIAFETIRDAAIDGSFLNKRHTITRFRKEFAVTTKPDAIFTGQTNEGPRGSLIKKAYEEAQQLLRKPKALVVTKDQSEKMTAVVQKRR